MGERIIGLNHQDSVRPTVTPRQLFQETSKLARNGVIQGGGNHFYDAFVGQFVDDKGQIQKVSIELHSTPGYDYVFIHGANMRGTIHNNIRDSYSSGDDRFKVFGSLPEDILDTLSKLEPDIQAMRELDNSYRNSRVQPTSAKRILDDPFIPFWEAEKTLSRLSSRDANAYVTHGRGRLLPFWIRKRFSGN